MSRAFAHSGSSGAKERRRLCCSRACGGRKEMSPQPPEKLRTGGCVVCVCGCVCVRERSSSSPVLSDALFQNSFGAEILFVCVVCHVQKGRRDLRGRNAEWDTRLAGREQNETNRRES